MSNLKSNNYKDLLIELIKTNFKIRYNNSVLGFIWVLIRPFATFVILYTVWSAFRGQDIENYQVKLLLGIILFTFIKEGIIFGMNGLLDKAHIILKVNFPREIAVMSSVAMALINLLINLLIFVVFALFNPVDWSLVGYLWFFVVIIGAILFIYGFCLYLSILLIRLRDLQHIFELFFELLFWVTPIFYEVGDQVGQIGGKIGKIISLNPVGMLIDIARDALINGKIATINIWGRDIESIWFVAVLYILAFMIIISGRVFFNSQVKKVAEYF
ncbi:hypothetical protein GF362_06155 [Candidatus Dojkabacteria bacterium]|nr:hypothetical protein [Candidatus Dojkabacteria bacterium]